MGIMIKHSVKNIFAKPLRLLLLVICIMFASFTALLAADMRNNIEDLLKGYKMDMLGKMDIMAYNTTPDIVEGIDEIAEIKMVGIGSSYQYEYERDKTGYEYSFEKPIEIISLSDMQAAYEMAFIPEVFELDDDSAVVTKTYADTFAVSEGDTIHFETRDEVDIELKVIKVTDIKNTIIKQEGVLVTNEIVRRLNCTQKEDYQYWMIDVGDDSKVTEVADALRHNDPKAELEVVADEMGNAAEEIGQISNMFYLMFLISFLLVIFVTISIAEKIINERMSVIGTLRSLGVTQEKTAFVLLIENILYAVTGSGLGILIYSKLKPGLLSSMINTTGDDGRDMTQYLGATPLYIYLVILAGAILVECAYPLFELMRAVKTPIRDIIFDNKDTEFKYRWGRLYTGIVMAVISVVSGLLTKNFITLAVSLSFGVVALALLIPFLIRIISGGLTAIFRKTSFPIALLAAENISRNRIIMGTAVLCVTSLTLSILIGGVGEALSKDLDQDKYDCDLRVDIYTSDRDHSYRYIGLLDGVEEMDYVYASTATGKLGDDKKKSLVMLSDTPHTMLIGLPEEGYGLKENEIVISDAAARRLGCNIGDEIGIILDPDTDFPTERVFIIKATADAEKNPVFGNSSVIINKDLYDHLYSASLSQIYIKAADPDKVKTAIEKHSESSSLSVETMEQIRKDNKEHSKGILTVMRLIVAGSAALSLIGIAGNQSLGFLTRKRETALLYSVALPKAGCRRLIFFESLFSMGISAVIAAIVSPLLYRVMGHLFSVIADGDIDILSQGGLGAKEIVMYLSVIFAVFLMTTLIPSHYLRKMNIAEELKYE